MKAKHLFTKLNINLGIVIPVVLTFLIKIFGAISVYLAEHKQQDANITNLGDGLWWAVETITTVGYGDYYPSARRALR